MSATARPEPSTLPPDDHTHTEWSWDAHEGSMDGACASAVELGLPAIAFTEHVDLTAWAIPPSVRDTLTRDRHLVDADGRLHPPPLDVEGYLASIERCRDRYPELRILTGVELGEPHWFTEESAALLGTGRFERVLGSLHSLPVRSDLWLVDDLFGDTAGAPALGRDQVVRAYLEAAHDMVVAFPDDVQVLAHIDYPVRHWTGDFDPGAFEDEFRGVLSALAASGRALEVNTRIPLAPAVVAWWREAGGEAVSFGSDAHRPADVAAGFRAAAAMVEAHGFRRDRHPHGFWYR